MTIVSLHAVQLGSRLCSTCDTDFVPAVRLTKIQQEILAQVAERLPPEMRVLDLCLRLRTRSERMDVLRESCTGNGKKVPVCGLTALRSNSAQLVSDMEDRDLIPDRSVLHTHLETCAALKYLTMSCLATAARCQLVPLECSMMQHSCFQQECCWTICLVP